VINTRAEVRIAPGPRTLAGYAGDIMKTINLTITIDTNSLATTYPSPSKTSRKPTSVQAGAEFIVVTGTPARTNQSTGDVAFEAAVGDQVMIVGMSGSGNFDDAILIYRMKRADGDRLFGDFTGQLRETSTVAPGSDASVLPAQMIEKQFWFYQADVREAGSGSYELRFGLWRRDPSTGDPELFGYFEWSISISILSPSPSPIPIPN
jgi:hypothetical protein